MELVTVLTETATAIDMTILDSIIEVTKTVIGMFTVFPLNVYLTAGIGTIGIGFFTALKHA